MKLIREVKFGEAFDKRDPDPSKNYGIGCVRVWMLLKGSKGIVQFVFSTGMYLPETHREYLPRFPRENKEPYMGFDVGYHALKPQYKGHSSMECQYTKKGKCYYDGSSLRAEEWMDIFIREGGEKIWSMLEEEYKKRFES